MQQAATVEVIDDAATDTCMGTLWLNPTLALIATAPGFAELCRVMESRLAELVDEADRNHEDWTTSPGLLLYRGRPLRFLDRNRCSL